MANFIGREHEKGQLNAALTSNKSELIAVYGRRRVGKTYLIREVYAKHAIFTVSGIHNLGKKDQINNFVNQIVKRSSSFGNKAVPKNWGEAFDLLQGYVEGVGGNKKKVIFIDEFPWMHTHKSNFVSYFANFWNTFCATRSDLVVVVCGSAASFMIKMVINDKGGLHNRISFPIRLESFNLYETELFLKSRKIHLGRYDYLQLYMAIGGIPHYLEKIEPGDSVPVAINRLCFQAGGILVNEFNIVFGSLFDNSKNHQLVVETLSKTPNGLTRDELIAKSGVRSGGGFSNVIQELIESGFVSEYLPYGKTTKDKLYRLSDEYSVFYLKFIKPNPQGNWTTLFVSRSYTSWSGFAFETLCLKHVNQIKKGLGINGIPSKNFSWRNGNAQIDLLIERADNSVNICELKFSNDIFTISKSYADNLENKKIEFGRALTKRKNLFITMVTTYGVSVNKHSDAIMDNQIVMDSLFEKL